ncbi:MAG: hypothetical protein KA163_06270 [Bacteroidia bacterium]|nr:hypothetical protein [Bacteroidia bacterium]
MKVFLSILLYLICSDCRIDEGSTEKISYNVLTFERTNYENKDLSPVVIKDLTDYSNFYFNYYGTYPPYTDFDFSKYMMVFFFVSTTYGTEIEDVYETYDNVYVQMHSILPGQYVTTQDIKTYLIAISLKQSNKIVKVYN